MTPTISIILTTHDGRKEACKGSIESVLAQTYKDYELIVVDDASRDGTKEMIRGFTDPRIQVIRRTKNFGNDTLPKNRGIKASVGRYIAFLDAGNRYRPDHLQALLNVLENDSDVAMVYGDRWVIDSSGKLPAQRGATFDYQPAKLLSRNYIDTSDVLVRREALEYVGGFDEREVKYIDWNLWLRLEKAGYTFKRVPLIMTDYVMTEDSKSVKVFTKREQEYLKLHNRFMNIPDWDPIDCEIRLPYLGPIPEPRVAIYTLTMNRLEYTKQSFESLYKTAGYPFAHFIVDNGSTDGTPDYLRECRDNVEQVIYNPTNVGISKASNQALEAIGTDYDIIVKVDNDAVFLTEGWLAKMVEIWKSNNILALSCYVQGLKDNPGGAPRTEYGQIRGELVGMTNHLGGICVFCDARAYRDWRWNDTDFLHGVQDLEFSQHLVRSGYQCCYLENYYLSHGPDGTEAQHAEYAEYFETRKTEKRTRYETGKSD